MKTIQKKKERAKIFPLGISIEYHAIPYFREPNDKKCYHNAIKIHQGEAFLRCRKCDEPIDPMQWLIRLAEQESRERFEFGRLREANEKIKAEIDKKTRCKCEHCGKMTTIPH